MSLAPSPLPSHIYKILPHHTVDPRYSFPIPIPASHEFFVSDLDAQVCLTCVIGSPLVR